MFGQINLLKSFWILLIISVFAGCTDNAVSNSEEDSEFIEELMDWSNVIPEDSLIASIWDKLKLNQNLSPVNSHNTFIDDRDGKAYRYTNVGDIQWMTENLRVETSYSYCHLDDETTCKALGYLYKIQEVEVEKICPSGWQLPTANHLELLNEMTRDSSFSFNKANYGWVDQELSLNQNLFQLSFVGNGGIRIDTTLEYLIDFNTQKQTVDTIIETSYIDVGEAVTFLSDSLEVIKANSQSVEFFTTDNYEGVGIRCVKPNDNSISKIYTIIDSIGTNQNISILYEIRSDNRLIERANNFESNTIYWKIRQDSSLYLSSEPYAIFDSLVQVHDGGISFDYNESFIYQMYLLDESDIANSGLFIREDYFLSFSSNEFIHSQNFTDEKFKIEQNVDGSFAFEEEQDGVLFLSRNVGSVEQSIFLNTQEYKRFSFANPNVLIGKSFQRIDTLYYDEPYREENSVNLGFTVIDVKEITFESRSKMKTIEYTISELYNLDLYDNPTLFNQVLDTSNVSEVLFEALPDQPFYNIDQVANPTWVYYSENENILYYNRQEYSSF